MKNKIGIIVGMVFIALLFAVVNVSAVAVLINNTCYQEFANKTSSIDGNCSIVTTGNYANNSVWDEPVQNSFDGYWGTVAGAQFGETANVTVNYTKPAGSGNAIWRFNSDDTGTKEKNISSTCWAANSTKLTLRYSSVESGGWQYNNWYCWNSTTWESLYSFGSKTTGEGYNAGRLIYEEALIWNIKMNNLTQPSGLYGGYLTSNTLNVSINFSLYNSSAMSTCWYVYGDTNYTINCNKNTSFKLKFWDNLTMYINDTNVTTNHVYYDIANWSYEIMQNNVSFSNVTVGQESSIFGINITYGTSRYSGITAYLTYNNTNYTLSTSNTGSTRYYSTTINIPQVTSTIVKNFTYGFILTNSTATVYYNSTQFNQTINTLAVDNCSVNAVKVFTIWLYNEESPLNNMTGLTNGTIEINLDVLSTDRSQIITSYNASQNYTTAVAGRGIPICINSTGNTYVMDFTIKHNADSNYYFTKYVNRQNMTFNSTLNINQNVTLYSLLQSLGYSFQIFVRGAPYPYFDNAGLLVNVQRQYTGLDQFYSVESPVTDSEGISIAHLIPSAVLYTFTVSKNGANLGSFNNYQVKCANTATGDCSIILNLALATATIPDFSNYGGVSGVYLLDSANSKIYYTYSMMDSAAHNVTSIIRLMNTAGNTTLDAESQISASGTLTMDIPSAYINQSYYAETYIDGEYIGTTYFNMGDSPNWHGVAIFLEVLLFTSLVMLFSFEPKFMIFGGIVGMMISLLLFNLASGDIWVWFGIGIWFVGAGVAAVLKMKRGYG